MRQQQRFAGTGFQMQPTEKHKQAHTQQWQAHSQHSQVHDHALVDLLPQVGPEDLDERDLQGRNLAVHEDAGQVQLHLEAHVDVGTIDRGGPPQREAPVGDLVQPRSLGVGQLLVPVGTGGYFSCSRRARLHI